MRLLRLALISAVCGVVAHSYAIKPNIIYILTDDLGFGDVTCYNPDSKIPTPFMDSLSKDGMRFTAARTPTAVCTPARYGVLTGRHCYRTRLKEGVLWQGDSTLIEHDRLTVASMLKSQGYATAIVGKWHLGLDWALKDPTKPQVKATTTKPSDINIDFSKPLRYGPKDYGFDYSFITPSNPGYVPAVYIEDNMVVDPDVYWSKQFGGYASPGYKSIEGLPTHVAKAENWLVNQASENPTKPMFLYLATTSPHYPILPTEEFIGKSAAGKYGDFVNMTDWVVGRMMHLVDSLAMRENTLIIVTSDNGPETLTCELSQKYGHRSAADLKGMKRDTWEGGVRVPFIARWPGTVPSGIVSDETICLTDFLATAAAIVGYKLPDNAGEDSYSILPVLLNKPLDAPLRQGTMVASVRGGLALVTNKWAYIDGKGSNQGNKYPLSSFHGSKLVGCGYTSSYAIKKSDPPGQLYDMETDYQQTKNVYSANPAVVKTLDSLLEVYKTSGRSAPVDRNEPFFDDLVSARRDLTYGNDRGGTMRIRVNGSVVSVYGSKQFALSVFDLKGTLIMKTVNHGEGRVSLPMLRTGMYVIRVSSESERFTRKFFVVNR